MNMLVESAAGPLGRWAAGPLVTEVEEQVQATIEQPPPVVNRALVAQLVGDAQRQGLGVDSEDGLLAQLTKLILESALEGELTAHLGYDKHQRTEGVNARALAFVQRYRDELGKAPVWLFSSGPLGTDRVDKDGRDVLESSRPKEFDDLVAMVRPRGERVFFGAYDPTVPPIGLGERLVGLMPAARDALPAGDFRDWPAIDVWALEIAASLVPGQAAAE